MNLRRYHSEDWTEVAKLFYDTVHSINAADYTEIQLNAWVPEDMDLPELESRLSNTYSVVVENGGIIIGFGNENGTGYFDCLYVHKDYQRMGVGSLIADNIEGYFFDMGIQIITTDASITAKPFFEKRGYVVLKRQNVKTRGHGFINFKMQKELYQ